MSESDIYKVKESPWAKKNVQPASRRRRKKHQETFDETVNKDISGTHQRRSKNSGFRRFIHKMKKPDYSRKFWAITLSAGALILLILVVWDLFLRYPKSTDSSAEPSVYRVEVD